MLALPEEGVWSFGTEVTDGCDLPILVLGIQLRHTPSHFYFSVVLCVLYVYECRHAQIMTHMMSGGSV